MAIVRITWIPENRRAKEIELEMPVRGFRGATAVLAKDLRKTCTHDFRNRVMRLWAECGKSGGFTIREKHFDTWYSFEYQECGGFPEEMPHDIAVRESLHSSGFHQYCNKGENK